MIDEKYITVKGSSVRTLTSGRAGKAIVFVHGVNCSADFWNGQLADAALQQYRLIAFDLPGHGRSERSGCYGLHEVAMLIPELIAQLDLGEYILAGVSYGTCLIGEAAPFVKGCKGFFLSGVSITNDAHPPASFLVPAPEGVALVSPSVPDEILTQFAERLIPGGDPLLIGQFKENYLRTDPVFRTDLGKTIMEEGWSDELANLLAAQLPACFVFGENEKIVYTDYLDDYPGKWNDRVYRIERAGHLVNLEQPGAFNKLLMEFAAEVFK